jgi:Mn-containing catalase
VNYTAQLRDQAASHVRCTWAHSTHARRGSRLEGAAGPWTPVMGHRARHEHGPIPRSVKNDDYANSGVQTNDPRRIMYLHTQQFINEIAVDEPDPAAANALQEGLGGQFGEMRTMMQYLFQSMNFRGDATSKPYKDLLQGVGTEEISHVELIGTTISRLLDGSPEYKGKKTDPVDQPGVKGATPLKIALDTSNIHHYLVGAQGALPVDAAGNPWSGSYVYNSGNLVLDLLYNLMLESTGRLQKCRIYEMTANKTARSTIAYLIVRDQAHENAFAKALESLGVNWGAALPIPKTNAARFPEVKKLLDKGLQSIQYTFSADDQSQADKLYRGASPSNDGTELSTAVMPEGFPMTIAPERREEFSPGLDKELLALIQATAEVETASIKGAK